MSKPGTGTRILPELSNFTPKATNSTPNTANQINAPGNPHMDPQENLTWNLEDPTEGHFSDTKFTLIHNTTNHCSHLYRHPVPHQDCIRTRDFGKNS